MNRTLAIDGTEWLASDMRFDQDGKIDAITLRTRIWGGTSGVWLGGAVVHTTGLTVSVAGTLLFHVLGETGKIPTPAAQTAVNGATNYVIALLTPTTDTPAAYYAGGSPPDLHSFNVASVTIRTSGPAIEANGEVNLATVVASGGTVTAITDTRKLLPYYDASAGNLVLGPGIKVDGVDPDVDLCPITTVGGAWTHDTFIGSGGPIVGTDWSDGVIDDSDFAAAAWTSHMFQPTRDGDLYHAIMNLRLYNRFTLSFHADTVQSVTVNLVSWDDNVRLVANGTRLFHATVAGDKGTAGAIQSFNTVIGTNTIQIYQANTAGDLGSCIVECGVLAQSGIRFNG